MTRTYRGGVVSWRCTVPVPVPWPQSSVDSEFRVWAQSRCWCRRWREAADLLYRMGLADEETKVGGADVQRNGVGVRARIHVSSFHYSCTHFPHLHMCADTLCGVLSDDVRKSVPLVAAFVSANDIRCQRTVDSDAIRVRVRRCVRYEGRKTEVKESLWMYQLAADLRVAICGDQGSGRWSTSVLPATA